MKNNSWHGIFVALWTPTDSSGELMRPALKANISFLKRCGVHGILALGSTGEFHRIGLPQRKQLVEATLAEAGGIPVLVNITDHRPSVVTDLARFAKQSGAAGVALMTPSFYPLAQADLVEWFVSAAQATDLPFFLYNFPERTGIRIAPETIAAIADRVPVAGIKQSGAEFSYNQTLVKLGKEKNFVLFVGSDTRIIEGSELGAAGCIGGLANAIPDLMVRVYNALKNGDRKAAAQDAENINVIGKLVDQLEFPINVAALMAARGLEPGHPKLPVSKETRQKYKTLMDQLQQTFAGSNILPAYQDATQSSPVDVTTRSKAAQPLSR